MVKITYNERIAQAMIIPVDGQEFKEVGKLSDTGPGTGGLRW